MSTVTEVRRSFVILARDVHRKAKEIPPAKLLEQNSAITRADSSSTAMRQLPIQQLPVCLI